MQGIPGNSINLSAAQNDIGSHEYMEAETQDPNGASDSPKERSSRSSPSLFGGNPMGTRSWSVSPRFTVTPVLNDQLHKVQLQTTPKDTNHKHGPAPSSELTASPRSLADTLIQASKFETSGTVNTSTKGSAYYRGERTPRPSTKSRDDPQSRSSSENRRATGYASQNNTEPNQGTSINTKDNEKQK